jgi:hypothetical protein
MVGGREPNSRGATVSAARPTLHAVRCDPRESRSSSTDHSPSHFRRHLRCQQTVPRSWYTRNSGALNVRSGWRADIVAAAPVVPDPHGSLTSLYSTSTIIYTDAANPIGRLATPADVRICRPASPKTSTVKSDAPFMAAAWSVHSRVLLIKP